PKAGAKRPSHGQPGPKGDARFQIRYNPGLVYGPTPWISERSTKMAQVGFGIVGTGFIAGVIADAIAKSTNAKFTAVSSRRIENARKFTAERQGVAAVQGIDSLLARP